jgi:uncharacterized membrane protein
MATSAIVLMLAAAEETARQHGTFEAFFKALTLYLSAGVEAAASIIIGLAAIEATVRALATFFSRQHAPSGHDPREAVRLRLGRWLAVALEFLLAADILRTAVAPTWNEIGQLAAIVVLRTALNYFLQKEIDTAVDRRQRADAAALTAPAPGTPNVE